VITSASFPSDLGSWDQDEHPYYLEVFGEVEPVLDMAHAEVIPAGGLSAATTNATPIYEYWWTLGHGGSKPHHRHLFEGRTKLELWERLEDVAARVYLFFPISGGWRVQELAASAKYLSPVQRHRIGPTRRRRTGSACNRSSPARDRPPRPWGWYPE
jgi:hypothetical protein